MVLGYFGTPSVPYQSINPMVCTHCTVAALVHWGMRQGGCCLSSSLLGWACPPGLGVMEPSGRPARGLKSCSEAHA